MPERVESIHFSDLVADGTGGRASTEPLVAHYGDLVRFASQSAAGRARNTPVRCRRRPHRVRCGGFLAVSWQTARSPVEWRCPACGAAGMITGWSATQADLRAMRRRSQKGLIEVAITLESHAALCDVARFDPELGRIAFAGQVGTRGRSVLFVGSDETELLRSRLATQALISATARARRLLVSIVDALPGASAESGGGQGFVALRVGARRPTVRQRPPGRRPAQTYEVKVTLRDVSPPIWRRLQVASDILLPELHAVLQAAMGWHDCHLHLFRVKNDCYAPPGDWEPLGADSRNVALCDLAPGKGARLVYEYDFGDGWSHDIVVESVLPQPCDVPRCLAGRRRCPPEDCGGPWGYGELLEALADRRHERRRELQEWHGGDFDPSEFDLDDVNARLQQFGRA